MYTPLLYCWARRWGLHPADAADLVQDVFVILVQQLPTFEYDPDRRFRNWLRTITLNKLRERQRRKVPAQAASEALANLPDDHSFWEDEYLPLLVQQALQRFQGDFQPATWQAFVGHGLEGRPAAEVAAQLGLTAGAVRAAKLRVVCRLRQELDGLLD